MGAKKEEHFVEAWLVWEKDFLHCVYSHPFSTVQYLAILYSAPSAFLQSLHS